MTAMISYAQNFEDVILERIFKGKGTGFYIDIGACHPVYDSVTYHFYLKGWSGINLEPQPAMFAELVSVRDRDINLQLCVGQQPGQMTLAVTRDIGTSTLDLELAEAYSRAERVTDHLRVELVTLNQLWAGQVGRREVDFLKIDVEGFERFVLLGADFGVVRPSVIVIEAIRPDSEALCHEEWEHLLLEHYEFFYFDGLNRFYQRKGFVPDQRAIHASPNVFDRFKTYPHFLLERELSEQRAIHEARLTANESALADAASAYRYLRAAYDQKEQELRRAHELLRLKDKALWSEQGMYSGSSNNQELHEPSRMQGLKLRETETLENELHRRDIALANAAEAYQHLKNAYDEKTAELAELHATFVTQPSGLTRSETDTH